MTESERTSDKSAWAIGGGVVAGLGVGLFLLKTSALFFVGSILAGLGIGMIATAVLSTRSGR